MSAESFDAYRARVLGYLGRRDPMRVLARTPARLEALIRSRSRSLLVRRPAPDKWSAIEIIAHLADAELVFGWRVRTMLASPNTRLTAVDQDGWAAIGRYFARSPARSLALFRAQRESNLALLRDTPRRNWSTHHAQHEIRGRVTLADLVQLEAAHDLNHFRQINSILGASRAHAST